MGAYRYCYCNRNEPVPMSAPTLVEAMTGEHRCPRCHANHWQEDDRVSAVQELIERLETLEAKAASPTISGFDLASGPDLTAEVFVSGGEIIHVAHDPDDWRPISTAPKTGEQIELGGPSGYVAPNDWHVETGHWRGANFKGGWWVGDNGDAITDAWQEPTHWRRARPRPKGA